MSEAPTPPIPLPTPPAKPKATPRGGPQDPESERAILGAVLLNQDWMPEIQSVVHSDDFAIDRHRIIFQAMVDLSERQVPIDTITLADELKSTGSLAAAGGPAYLASLDANVPTTANVGRYATIVHDRAVRRRLLLAAGQIADLARDDETTSAMAASEAERLVFGVTNELAIARDVATIRDDVRVVYTDLEKRNERGSEITGTPTGFRDLDKRLTGMHAGDLIVLAARPSMGKTAMALNIAGHVGIDRRRPVLVFSLEMPKEQLVERLMASDARVDSQRLRTGQLNQGDWRRIAVTCDRLFAAPIVVRDETNLSVFDMRGIARRTRSKLGDLGLVVVDYLQLMTEKGKQESREQEVAAISRGLKSLAREMRCPVVALSQLNRGLEKRPDKRPVMSDLRESGAIEQDADVICFLYRDEVYNSQSKDQGTAEVIVAKQRNGPTGTVKLAFRKELTRFEDLAQGSVPDDGSWG